MSFFLAIPAFAQQSAPQQEIPLDDIMQFFDSETLTDIMEEGRAAFEELDVQKGEKKGEIIIDGNKVNIVEEFGPMLDMFAKISKNFGLDMENAEGFDLKTDFLDESPDLLMQTIDSFLTMDFDELFGQFNEIMPDNMPQFDQLDDGKNPKTKSNTKPRRQRPSELPY